MIGKLYRCGCCGNEYDSNKNPERTRSIRHEDARKLRIKSAVAAIRELAQKNASNRYLMQVAAPSREILNIVKSLEAELE